MEDKMKLSIETGAMTLTLLVKNYKSQMIALLLKNGVTIPKGASDEEITVTMANLLRVSKSFMKDLNTFVKNPKVVKSLLGSMSQNAQYFRATGFAGKEEGNAQYFRADGDNVIDSATPKKSGFFSGLNFGDLLSQGLGAFGTYSTNQANVEIARAHAQVKAGSGAGSNVGSQDNLSQNTGLGGQPIKEGVSTTTVVVLSLVGVAVLGTIIYFVAKSKK